MAGAAAQPSGRLIDIGGRRLHITCRGAGRPAVVFDAALGASSISWTLVQREVARHVSACAYDRAGFGWSDAGPAPRTAGTIADELQQLLSRAGVPAPYVLVGHSFGALVVRIVAARAPDLVAGLVLVDPALPEEWLAPGEHARGQIARGVQLCRYGATAARLGLARVVSALVGAGALGPARALVSVVSRGGFSRADEDILAPVWKLPPEARRPLRRFWSEPKFFEALGSQIASICDSAAEAQAASLDPVADRPVIVISADSASAERRRLHAALARRFARGDHRIAPDSGHWVPLDRPGVVAQAVLDVVAAWRAGAAHGAP